MTTWITRSETTRPLSPHRAAAAHLTAVLDEPVPPYHAVDPDEGEVACHRIAFVQLRVSDDQPWSPTPGDPDWCEDCVAEVARRADRP